MSKKEKHNTKKTELISSRCTPKQKEYFNNIVKKSFTSFDNLIENLYLYDTKQKTFLEICGEIDKTYSAYCVWDTFPMAKAEFEEKSYLGLKNLIQNEEIGLIEKPDQGPYTGYLLLKEDNDNAILIHLSYKRIYLLINDRIKIYNIIPNKKKTKV